MHVSHSSTKTKRADIETWGRRSNVPAKSKIISEGYTKDGREQMGIFTQGYSDPRRGGWGRHVPGEGRLGEEAWVAWVAWSREMVALSQEMGAS